MTQFGEPMDRDRLLKSLLIIGQALVDGLGDQARGALGFGQAGDV